MAKPISCVLTGLQPGHSRFINKLLEERPKLKAWRCELTALSHVYNLYFVAYSDSIHVYQPTFPDQKLPNEPALILRPPVSSPHLSYALDPQCPHSINRLHLDYLGREEIVLVVCDDGDTIGYSVTKIQRAVERRAASEVRDDDHLEEDVKVFLHRNAGISAWGLAVHQQGRMIALSANSHEVTVIAYALANPSETDSDSSDSSLESLPSSNDSLTGDFPFPRRKDHILTLRAQTNIPSISFDNNDTDPTGRWLFSSTIDGKTILWDLHNPEQPARILQLGHCVNVDDPCSRPTETCRCPDRDSLPHAAWHAMFVDPRSCRKSPSFQDAFGVEPTERAPCYWDITSSKPRGPPLYSNESNSSDGSEADVLGNDAEATPDPASGAQEQQTTDSDEISENESEQVEDEATAPETDDDQEEGSQDAQSLFIPEPTTANEAPSGTDYSVTVHGFDAQGGPLAVTMNLNMPVPVNFQDLLAQDEDSDGTSELMEELPLEITHRQPRQRGKKPYFELTTSQDNHTQPPPSIPPAVIVTKQDIYLVQPRYFSTPPPTLPSHSSPVIMLRYPQFSLGAEVNAPQHDRLCYATQIPELGIVLAATPAQKVVILSLTQIVTEQKGTGKRDTVYGMKIEHVVPGAELETRMEHDEHGFALAPLIYGRLVGFAVGPVQGMLDIPADEIEGGKERGRVDGEGKPRRWRLILMYQDHSVVTYELGMQSENDDTGVADLMV
ncbi:hypothetical protein BDV96DRAFT_372352 [Lophiotrema nucula]|uniref:WD40-repeat-containing domain protein n=1 Tax=Lophiotrema nucula TaxID=690887 RepID=A0A6A5ZJX4_9PLEO|nr:hypothetical protein BDV96DRAFT_372352 [Lophiotrema nucula]